LAAALVVCAVLVLIYLADAGHGLASPGVPRYWRPVTVTLTGAPRQLRSAAVSAPSRNRTNAIGNRRALSISIIERRLRFDPAPAEQTSAPLWLIDRYRRNHGRSPCPALIAGDDWAGIAPISSLRRP